MYDVASVMKKTSQKKTASMVCEIPIKVTPQQEAVLLSRLEAARQMYNACLGEAIRRVDLIRQCKAYNKARSLKPKDRQRAILFKQARTQWNFSDYAIQAYGTGIRRSWIGDHIDAHTGQKIATRAYLAAERVLFGRARRIRFKSFNQMDSVESKSNTAGIRWRNEGVEWSALKLAALIKDYDPVIAHGLSSRVKYVRLVRRKRNGKNLFYAQLVCEGMPFRKPKNLLGVGEVGIDIGPSTIAVVADNMASLQQFAAQLEHSARQIRKLQRRMDRSRRANNQDNYNSNKTVKKGSKKWNNSKTYLKVRNSKANLERNLAAHRKSLHGELVNSILLQGNVFKLEKLSYKAFQKRYGKSVGRRAPGMFVAHLKRKAENAGGRVVEFPTYNTKLSQTCQCGRVKKKKLSQRVHECSCGVVAQRDLYSAFLAKYIDPDTNVLQVNQVLSAWYSVESHLWAAWRAATVNQPATGRLLPSSFGCCPELERVATAVQTKIPESQNVVDANRESGKGYPAFKSRAVGTPLLKQWGDSVTLCLLVLSNCWHKNQC